MTDKPSPAQRRKTAISARFQPWYLTDGMTSPALHISAGYRAIRQLSTIRTEIAHGGLTLCSRKLYAESAIRSAKFNLFIGRRSSPLP
ncbi:hypothetical protein OIU34_02485 [Pararhizobium sp. BT-229]|uniref:hypothetical protein n=1 Tax=Pararhizobium sp. BT-229 TaxID=2986923 RepID=UPI0021F7054D|nr:hypothetical protein [Pararhizobium sp. BT-229]MCV9960755.1 hypothetical protein [Pararhizobium sp. BT-229]